MHNQKNFLRNILLLSAFPLFCSMVMVVMLPMCVHAEESSYYSYTFIKQQTVGSTLVRDEYYITSPIRLALTPQISSTDPIGTYYNLVFDNNLSDNTLDGASCQSISGYQFHHKQFYDGNLEKDEVITSGNEGIASKNDYIVSTNIPMFGSYESAYKFLNHGDDSGQINKTIDFDSATYNSKIPVPKLVFNSKGGYKFSIDNAVEGYYIQIKGRWYTVDDITLFKENLQWKYKYDTLLKGTLTEWVAPNDKVLATAEHDLCDMNRNGYGAAAFTALINQYGIEQRNYFGGTNALGNKLSGYTDALSMLKEFHLNNPLSAFNSPEIYIRFIVVNDDKTVQYGKWCHWYSNLANSSGSSGSNIDDSDNVSGESQSYNGLTEEEFNTNEQQENPRNDSDIYTYVNSDYIKQNIEISSDIANKTGAFFELLNSMFSAMGQFPQMFKDVFMFLPPWFINFIIISMGAIIIARFIGR